VRGCKRDQRLLIADRIAAVQVFGVGAVVAVLGRGGKFHALLGEVYVGWRGMCCVRMCRR
jgi:hypothetical protein